MIDVVLDTSVLVAALRSRRGASFELLRLVGDTRWRLHLSTALLLEYEEVARREAQQFWAKPELVESILDFLCAQGVEHAISFRWRPALRDPDDDFLLELAIASEARYIVTHNVRDFVEAGVFGVEVITPAQLLLKLDQTS